MSEHSGDNEGRRGAIRTMLSNDPFYRRVKDAVLVVAAVAGGLSFLSPNILPARSNRESSLEEKVLRHDVSIEVLKASMDSFRTQLDRIERKMDRRRE